jgi:hypothetical protein
MDRKLIEKAKEIADLILSGEAADADKHRLAELVVAMFNSQNIPDDEKVVRIDRVRVSK